MTKISIYELFEGYSQALKNAELYAENIAHILQKVISKHIPDLEITVGGIEVGIEFLVFNSRTYCVGNDKTDEETPISLQSVIISVFPDIIGSHFHLDTDFGVYLDEKTAKAVKRELRKLKSATVSTDWISDSLEMSE
jgi:hypothetical protein